MKGSDREKSRKPGDVKSQKSVLTLRRGVFLFLLGDGDGEGNFPGYLMTSSASLINPVMNGST